MRKQLAADILIRTPLREELEAIVEMFTACDIADCGVPDSPLEQYSNDWLNPAFHPETDARVAVTSDGRIVAYADVQSHRPVRLRLELRVHPDYREQGIEERLLVLVEARAAELAQQAPTEERVIAQTWLHAGNLSGHAFLESQHYICNRHTWGMAIELQEAPEKPEWPQGITLRPFVSERDARAVFEADDEAFEDHWGHLPGNFENWYHRHIGGNEQFDSSLWFIALEGEEIAGIALCTYYLQDGLVDILGVRRPWRRKGLGLALLRHAFGEFYARSTRKVILGVDSQNLTGATRLYERAGMHIELQYDTYEKELRAGIDRTVRNLAS